MLTRRDEQFMRLDYLQRKHAWEAALARDADSLPSDLLAEEEQEEDETVYDLPSSSNAMQFSQPSTQLPPFGGEEEMADEVAQHEDDELQYLVGYLGADSKMKDESSAGKEGNLWSDDDEGYDELFEELMQQEQQPGLGQSTPLTRDQTEHEQENGGVVQDHGHDQGEAMDMS